MVEGTDNISLEHARLEWSVVNTDNKTEVVLVSVGGISLSTPMGEDEVQELLEQFGASIGDCLTRICEASAEIAASLPEGQDQRILVNHLLGAASQTYCDHKGIPLFVIRPDDVPIEVYPKSEGEKHPTGAGKRGFDLTRKGGKKKFKKRTRGSGRN